MPSSIPKYGTKLPGYNPAPEVVLSDPPAPSQNKTNNWTDYDVAVLRYGLKKKLPYSEIARLYFPYKSRNSLIGKAQRLRLNDPGEVGDRSSVGGHKRTVRRSEYRRAATDGVDKRLSSNKDRPKITLPSPKEGFPAIKVKIPEHRGRKKTFNFEDRLKPPQVIETVLEKDLDKEPLVTELKEGQCRWPIGQGSDGKHRFCRNYAGFYFDRRGLKYPDSWCAGHIHKGRVVVHGVEAVAGKFPLPKRIVDKNQSDD